MFGNFKISNEEYISALTEINGVTPENWFIAINKGKDKKVNRGFLVNNTEDIIQLIPIKKENKAYIVDKENVITLSKIEEITKIVYVLDDLYSFLRIHLNNGFTFKLRVYNVFSNKLRKKNFKEFRKPYKRQSVKAQVSLLIYYIIVYTLIFAEILFGALYGVIKIPNDSKLYYHYQYAKDLKQTVDSGYFDEYMAVTLEQYPYSDLKFEEEFSTVTHGKLRMNLPLDCKLNKELSLEDSTVDGYVAYSTDLEIETALYITIDSQPIDFSNNDIEGYAELIDTLRDTAMKEFGVSLDNHYNLTKAMWQMSSLEDNINYFSRNEVALYRFMLVMKMTMSSGVNNYYEINTPSYCGFVSIRNIGDSDSTIVNLDVFSYDNLNESYQITIFVRNGDINDAFKIINSVELVTE